MLPCVCIIAEVVCPSVARCAASNAMARQAPAVCLCAGFTRAAGGVADKGLHRPGHPPTFQLASTLCGQSGQQWVNACAQVALALCFHATACNCSTWELDDHVYAMYSGRILLVHVFLMMLCHRCQLRCCAQVAGQAMRVHATLSLACACCVEPNNRLLGLECSCSWLLPKHIPCKLIFQKAFAAGQLCHSTHLEMMTA